MIDTDKYPDGPDDERLIPLSKRQLRLMVWAYGCELQGLKKDSAYTDAYTLAEVKRLREAMKTMLDDMNNASPEEDIEYWLDTWKHWLKEMIK